MVTADLLGDVGQRVLHERRELRGVVDAEEGVKVIAHDRYRENTDAEQVLGAAQDPDDQVIRGRVRAQEKPASSSPGRDLHD